MNPTRHILLIEDDEDDYLLTRDLFDEIGQTGAAQCRLDWAANGELGLERLAAGGFDVCLCDYHLGPLTGLDILRRAQDSACPTPIILLTGQNDHATDMEAMRAGAADYLVKGRLAADTLERAIRYAIDRAHAQETLREYAAALEQQKAELERANLRLEVANASLEALATLDGLTGLKNHRAFQERLEEEYSRAVRYQSPLSLILLDVDHFKQYNDTFGHPAGDDVLKAVSEALTEGARVCDFAARYGGEEFAMILPETDREGAEIAAERLRAAIAGHYWTLRPITASFGVATVRLGMIGRADLIAAADRALYAAKASGRNRAVHSADLMEIPCELTA